MQNNMNILNIGYGISKPQARIHLVNSNVSLRLEDPRDNDNSSVNIELKTGSGIFGQGSNSGWILSSSNSIFNIISASGNSNNNILSASKDGNIIVSNNINIGGVIIKNGRDIIADTSNYIFSVNSNISYIINDRLETLGQNISSGNTDIYSNILTSNELIISITLYSS